MSDWHPERKKKFRGEVLTMLAGVHNNQQSRMDDLRLYAALQRVGVTDIELKDVVTICQDMKGRGWLTYGDLRNPVTLRVELHRIMICPEGQDLVDQTSTHPAVTFF